MTTPPRAPLFKRLLTFFRLVNLGATLGDRIAIAWSFAANRLSAGPVFTTVSVAGKRFPIIIDGPADRTVIREVFVDGEYSRAVQPTPRFIVDVGANVGMASLYMAARFPDAIIYAIEPCPQTYERLVRNTASNPSINTYNIAISSKNGEAAFFVSAAHFGSSLRARGAPGEREIRVQTLTMNSFLDQIGLERIGLLKFDIEGHEAELLRGLDIERVGQFIGELHFDLMNEKMEWFEERLSGRKVEISQTSPYRCVIVALEP